MAVSDEIKRLHELHQAGALTDAEFAQAKARVLNDVHHGADDGVNLNKPGYDYAAGSGSGGADLVNEFNRLRRARNDRWLGGVCGGLAKVSGMESWVWRLVFVLFTATFGFGAVIYLLMWIFVPDEEIGN